VQVPAGSKYTILKALEEGPLSTWEVTDNVCQQVYDSWYTLHKHTFEWDGPDEPHYARLSAKMEARKMGISTTSLEIGIYLRFLEAEGKVERMQVKGSRPLWGLPLSERQATAYMEGEGAK
jgi:hypothetical protein